MSPYAAVFAALRVPDDYLVVDTETNGMQTDQDLVLPVQVGYALVRGRRVVARDAITINWAKVMADHRMIREFWDRCRRTAENMRSRGQECLLTADRVAREGLDPREAWPAYHDLIVGAIADGLPLAGHNIFGFDCPLLEKTAVQMGMSLGLDAARILDFGLIEKAIATGMAPPDVGDSIAHWYARVRNAWRRGKWNLAPHCVEKYGLAADPGLAHDAGYDCWMSHLLIEAMRTLAEGPCGTHRTMTPPA